MIFRTNFFAELKLFEDLSNSSPINVTVAFTSTHTRPSCSNLIRFKFHAMSQSSHNGKEPVQQDLCLTVPIASCCQAQGIVHSGGLISSLPVVSKLVRLVVVVTKDVIKFLTCTSGAPH